jgi:hypothetical protein
MADKSDELSANAIVGLEDAEVNSMPNGAKPGGEYNSIEQSSADLDELFDAHESVASDEPADEADVAELQKIAADEVTPDDADPKSDAGEAEEGKGPEVEFEQVELPKHAAQSTREAFKLVKEGAAAKVAALRKERDELRARADELAAKTLPEDVEKKLADYEELRKTRAFYELEKDPDFVSKFDKQLEANETAVFAKLTEAKMPQAALEKIKELGVNGVDWDHIFTAGKFPQPLRMYIQTKLGQNLSLQDQRATELAELRQNADQFFKERDERTAKQRESDTKIAETVTLSTLAKMPWFEAREVPAEASPEVKSQIEADKAFAARAREMVKAGLSAAESPNLRAELVTGTILAHRFKLENDALHRRIAALEKDSAELAKVRKSSSVSGARKSAGAVGSTSAPKSGPVFGATSEEALDKLFEEADKK